MSMQTESSKLSSKRDITRELRPTEALAVILIRAAGDAFCDWVPEWAWELNKEKATSLAKVLREHGITDEMVKLKD